MFDAMPAERKDLSPKLELRMRINALLVIGVYQALVLVPVAIGALMLFWLVGRLTVSPRAPAFSRFVPLVQSPHMTHEQEATLVGQGKEPEPRVNRTGHLVHFERTPLGLLAGSASGQERFGLPEARIGALTRVLQPLPGRGRRLPPLGVGPSFQPGPLGLGEQQMAGD